MSTPSIGAISAASHGSQSSSSNQLMAGMDRAGGAWLRLRASATGQRAALRDLADDPHLLDDIGRDEASRRWKKPTSHFGSD